MLEAAHLTSVMGDSRNKIHSKAYLQVELDAVSSAGELTVAGGILPDGRWKKRLD